MKTMLSVLFCLAMTGMGWADDRATFMTPDENGCTITESKGLPGSGSSSFNIDDPSILWTHNVEWPIYTTCANCGEGYVFGGTYLNDPKEAELFAPGGGGTPLWTYMGNEFYVDASDDNFILAAINETAGGIDILKWTGPGTGTPDWAVSFPGVYVGSYGPYLEVSRDGSTIAAVVTINSETELLVFDAASQVPIVDYVMTGQQFPRGVQISNDGRYIGVRTNTWYVVYDRDLNAVRDQFNINYGTTPFGFSGDGNLLAYGWTSMIVKQWSGSSYQQLWTRTEPGYSLGCVSISDDGQTLVAGWYNSSFTTVRVVVHNSNSSTPIWSYNFPASSGIYQETIKDIEMSLDGRYIIVGSWGDTENINPEVHIFDRDAGSTPLFTVDMPGSVFSVDIDPQGRWASACGKNVHANQSGHGGDIVAIDMDLPGSDLSVTLTPLNPPIQIPAVGGSFGFNVDIENTGTAQVTFDAWSEIDTPMGSTVSPVLLRENLWLDAGWSAVRDLTQVVPGVAPAGAYTYRMNVGDYPTTVTAFDEFTFTKLGSSDLSTIGDWPVYGWEDESANGAALAEDYRILTISPNPFNPSTVLGYKLQVESKVNLTVYDIAGREVARLVDGWRDAGMHEVVFDGSGLSSGMYIYRLEAGELTAQGKMVLMK